MPKPWIILEPYYGGSHRSLVDGLRANLGLDLELWTLPPRKWKWRMRGAAPVFAERWHREQPQVEGIFTSSLLNVAELRGLLPPEARSLPITLYFHENQLNYPVRVDDFRDYHYGWINILSALAADQLLWNSEYNRDSFFDALPNFISKMPDHRPSGIVEKLVSKSQVLPVPIAPGPSIESAQNDTCRILWNHRWEHDKGPEEFFQVLMKLQDEGLEFELSVLGQKFSDVPKIFSEAKEVLASKIRRWGFVESFDEYRMELASADLVVSTAQHEFQGLSVLEAAAGGARPLLPNALAYPEIWPSDFLYEPGRLRGALRECIKNWPWAPDSGPRDIALAYSWKALTPSWRLQFADRS